MPLVSRKQEKFMFTNHPKIAKRWVAEAKAKGESPCPTCGGKGMMARKGKTMASSKTKCEDCGGSGKMEKGEES